MRMDRKARKQPGRGMKETRRGGKRKSRYNKKRKQK